MESEQLKELLRDYLLNNLNPKDIESVKGLIDSNPLAKEILQELQTKISVEVSGVYFDKELRETGFEQLQYLISKGDELPKKGEIWELKNFPEKVLVLSDADKSITKKDFRIMVLSNKCDFFAQKYDLVFNDKELWGTVNTAHTHLVSNILFSRFSKLNSKINDVTFGIINKIDNKKTVILPSNIEYGKGAAEETYDDFEAWNEYILDFLHEMREEVFSEAEKQIEVQIYNIGRVKEYIEKRTKTCDYSLAADSENISLMPETLFNEGDLAVCLNYDEKNFFFQVYTSDKVMNQLDYFKVEAGNYLSEFNNLRFRNFVTKIELPNNEDVLKQLKISFAIELRTGNKLIRKEFKQND